MEEDKRQENESEEIFIEESAGDSDLMDQIRDVMYDENQEPMDDETFAEIIKNWKASYTSTPNHPISMPHIDKRSYSLRKDIDGHTCVFLGEDSGPQKFFDPHAIPGVDLLDEEESTLVEMADFVLRYVNKVLERDGNGEPESFDFKTWSDSVNDRKVAKEEFAEKSSIERFDRIEKARSEAKALPEYIELKKKLEAAQSRKTISKWGRIKEIGGESASTIGFGTISEVMTIWDREKDPTAYIYQTRIYTGENGFATEGKILSDAEIEDILGKENAARNAWVDEYNAKPAITANTNNQPRSGGKLKSIRRLS